ncbi:receptor-like protein EIX2 [Henckelia pumila]|uniref:receptor-like protein EIX2 n=1 Tax=Henckelia pumila TaxID=405737 RepID=UPI003C6EA16A
MTSTLTRILTHVLVSTVLILACLGSTVFGQYSSAGNIRCFEMERQALLNLKDELVDESGTLSSWGAARNQMECCKWRGVRCDNVTNHVTQLSLTIPPPGIYQHDGPSTVAPLRGKISSSLLELKHLTYLDLSLNDFEYSNIPDFIGSFQKLQYLNLSSANFNGSIPQSVGNLSELMYLDFSSNSGLFSENLGWVAHLGSLEYLDLSFVELGNVSNWLFAISKLISIKELHLKNCGLQGILPSSLPSVNASAPLATLDLSMNPGISSSALSFFFNFSTSLTSIDFSFNNIIVLGSAFENQIFLEHLDLSNNNLEGGIPKFLGNMSNLVYLDLSSNSLMLPLSEIMSNFSGSVEKNLKHLDLSDNMITGSLPDFSKFSSLNALVLRGNMLNGSITKDYPNIPSLVHLDLSLNSFTGELPDLTIYPLLERLFLSGNMFNGPLNENIGSLSELKVLDLGSNNFQGIVTESHLFNLSRLRILVLSSNPLLTVNISSQWIPPFQLIAISLSNCKAGPRFPQWLRNQNILDYIDFSFSQIVDTIPDWIGDLASRPIRLNLSNNQIHGAFPEIGFSSFNLSNYMSSTIHVKAPGMIFDLSRNKITGEATFLCQSEEWILIDLSNNLFLGHLPDCFANSTKIRFLNLANNNFSGTIPSSFGSLPLLSLLNLRNNSFSGGIPASLRSCTGLKLVDFGGNRLTGIIPTWIGELFSLVVLSLRFNEFRGMIPSSICNLQNIVVLDLSLNKISGVIPKCLDNLTAMTDEPKQNFSNIVGTPTLYYTLQDAAFFMWKGAAINYVNPKTFVELLDLSSNALTGDIPSEITKLVGLNSLNLSRNSLSGQIPANIGVLKYLDSLDLSRNQLSGGIPASLSQLNFLGVFDLTYNNLSGRIPPLKFDGSSYVGNPGLCGRLELNISCPEDNKNTHQDGNLKHEEDHELISKGFYICMGLGFVFGFSGILGVILLNKSARCAYFKLLEAIEDCVPIHERRAQKSPSDLRREAMIKKF